MTTFSRPELLCAEELKLLTGCSGKTAQTNRLKAMGIPFGMRMDGVPVVSRVHVRHWIDPGHVDGLASGELPNWTK